MDKVEFINTLFDMYPQSFTESNREVWMDLYIRKLPLDIDFQELFDDMLTNYQNTKIAPNTAFFKPYIDKQKERIAQKQKENETLKQMAQWKKEREEIEKEDKPVTAEILSPLEVLKQSYGSYERESLNTFTDAEMKTFRQYVNKVIPTEKLRIKFWQQVCSLISGGKLNELIRG